MNNDSCQFLLCIFSAVARVLLKLCRVFNTHRQQTIGFLMNASFVWIDKIKELSIVDPGSKPRYNTTMVPVMVGLRENHTKGKR